MKIKTFSVNHYNRMGWGTKISRADHYFRKNWSGGTKIFNEKIGPQDQNYRDQNSSDISVHAWSMCFTIYTATVGIKHPEMTSDMLAYMLHILRSHREYEEPAWREYDVRFRQRRQFRETRPGHSWILSYTINALWAGPGE